MGRGTHPFQKHMRRPAAETMRERNARRVAPGNSAAGENQPQNAKLALAGALAEIATGKDFDTPPEVALIE